MNLDTGLTTIFLTKEMELFSTRFSLENIWGALGCAIVTIVLMAVIGIVVWRKKSKNQNLMAGLLSTAFLTNCKYKIALNLVNCEVFDFEPTGGIITRLTNHINSFASEMVMGTPQDVVNSNIIDKGYVSVFFKIFDDFSKDAGMVEAVVKTNNSEIRWVRLTLTSYKDFNQKIIGGIGTMEDVTEEKENQIKFIQEHQYANVLLSKSLFNFYANLSKNVILSCQNNGKSDYIGGEINAFDDFVKNVFLNNAHKCDKQKLTDLLNSQNLISDYAKGYFERGFVFRTKMSSEKYIWASATFNLMCDSITGDVLMIACLKNIDKEKKNQIALENAAQNDSLTGLLNRKTSEETISLAIQNTLQNEWLGALFMIDLDCFKKINDNFGHLQGDILLKKVAEELRQIFSYDSIIGRMGGDEFCVYVPNIPNCGSVVDKAQEICTVMRNFFKENSTIGELSASIGIAHCPTHGKDFVELYENADIALYIAKASGKNTYSVYDYEENAETEIGKKQVKQGAMI